jgi:curved DNA-binding protein CbpA
MCVPNTCLALEDSDFKGKAVLAPWAGAVALGSTKFAKRKEFAGHAFHEFTKRNAQPSGSSAVQSESDDVESTEKPDVDSPGSGKKDKKGKKSKHTECLQITDDIKDIDLYELLEVTEAASEKDIKATYRRLVLERHPDKLGRPATEADREHFARTQTAFEILSDPNKRRQYDSSKEFDDTVPTAFNRLSGDFFAKFRGVFEKNARFSSIKPVPPLGDENTPVAEVRQFYRFWKTFDSWRDPLADAQLNGEEICNLEEAECREERRWMEQENARVGRRFKKAETERVQGFVQLAMENDPRLIADAEARRQEKERAAQAKADAERAAEKARAEAEAEALAKAQAAEEARKAEKESKKAERDAVRRALKETRHSLRRDLLAFGDVQSAVVDSQLQLLIQEKSAEDCAALRADVLHPAATSESAVEALHTLIRALGVEPRTPSAEDLAALREAETGTAQKAKAVPEPVIQVTEEEKPKKQTAADKKAAAEAEKKRIADEEARAKKEEKKRREREAQKAKEEQRAAERAEAEKAKQAEAKAARDAAAQAADAEKKAARALKEKQKADEKAAEAESKAAELIAVEMREAFEEDRHLLMEQFDKGGVSLEGLAPEAVAAFAAIAAGFEYEEDGTVSRGALILREAGVQHADLAFPAPQVVEVTTTLRNALKKVRAKLRAAIADLLKNAKAPKGVNPTGRFETIMSGAVAPESVFKYVPGSKNDATKAEPQKAKAEKAAKGKGDEEDLDAILAEFGVAVDATSSKKKKKAGKK